jgi:hypothetical protein
MREDNMTKSTVAGTPPEELNEHSLKLDRFSDIFRKVAAHNPSGQFTAQRSFVHTFAGVVARSYGPDAWESLLTETINEMIKFSNLPSHFKNSKLEVD